MSVVKDRQNFLFPLPSGHNTLLIKIPHGQFTCVAQCTGSAELIQTLPRYARWDGGTASARCALPHLGDDTQNLGVPFGAV